MALISMSNTVVAPLFVVLQFHAQFQELQRQSGHPGALSLTSLAVHVPVMATVARRMFVRLGKPEWSAGDPRLPFLTWARESLQLWYAWGMVAINYAVCALGCLVLLVGYLCAERRSGRFVAYGERSPLFV